MSQVPSPTAGVKLVLVVRKDLRMGVGKIAAQCSHASVMAYQRSSSIMLTRWAICGQKKIVLSCPDEQALYDIQKIAEQENLLTSVVQDAGHTQVDPGTVTVLAVGPDIEEKIDRVTGQLSLL